VEQDGGLVPDVRAGRTGQIRGAHWQRKTVSKDDNENGLHQVQAARRKVVRAKSL